MLDRPRVSAAARRDDFRVTHYSVQGNHLHLIVEADDKEALSRGMQGLTIRIARAINRLAKRSGRVFADRFWSRVLATPCEVRHAIAYVLGNAPRRTDGALEHPAAGRPVRRRAGAGPPGTAGAADVAAARGLDARRAGTGRACVDPRTGRQHPRPEPRDVLFCRRMRIGGYVIHGNNADTLPRCLDALLAVCDEVVAVDSCSTDGSAEIVRSRGVRHVVVPWQGYGFARAAAAAELQRCDWIFFLDSDEWLAPGAAEAFARWRASNPRRPHYRLVRRDWAELPGRSFVYRSERHVRLVRREAATWTADMVVHEALPRRACGAMEAVIEHRFATSVEQLEAKQDRYALLWALRANAAGKRPKSTLLQRPAHVFRDCFLKGGFFRGGADALRLGWGVSRYHARKHQLLREVQQGRHADEVRAFAEGRWADLFR